MTEANETPIDETPTPTPETAENAQPDGDSGSEAPTEKTEEATA